MIFISCLYVEKEIILGNFIISNGWYELDVRDSMSLSIDFRWIVIFVLKRNNFREFCGVIGMIGISLLPFFH